MTTSIIKNTVSVDLIITTPKQLGEAFKLWQERWEDNPEDFRDEMDEMYAQDCTEFMISILKELNERG